MCTLSSLLILPPKLQTLPHHTCLCSPHYRNIHLPCTAPHRSTDPLNKACQSFSTLGNHYKKRAWVFFLQRMMPQDLYQNNYSRPLLDRWISKRGVEERLPQWKCDQYFYAVLLLSMSHGYHQSLEINRNFTLQSIYIWCIVHNMTDLQRQGKKMITKDHTYRKTSLAFSSISAHIPFPDYAHIPCSPSNCGQLLKQLQKCLHCRSLKDPTHTGTT